MTIALNVRFVGVPASFSKVGEIRRHYRDRRYKCHPLPWDRFETERMCSYIRQSRTFERVLYFCFSGIRSRSILEVYDRYMILLLLISMEVRKPEDFLHESREQRRDPKSELWKHIFRRYVWTYKSYFGLAAGVPGMPEAPRECIAAARSNFRLAQRLVTGYMDFYDDFVYERRPLTPLRRPPDFWIADEDLDSIDLHRPKRGWDGTSLPFSPRAREHRLALAPCPFDPDNRVAPLTNALDFRRIIRWYGAPGCGKTEAIRRHYKQIGGTYVPWTQRETCLLHHAIFSFPMAGQRNAATSSGGQTSGGHALAFPSIGVPGSVVDLFELQDLMREQGSRDERIHQRSLVEIHDRCLVLLAVRALGFADPVLFFHNRGHDCVRLSYNNIRRACSTYRKWFSTLNGLDTTSGDHPYPQAAWQASSVLFRMLREYHEFYEKWGTPPPPTVGSPCFDYFVCDLQELAVFIVEKT